VADTPKPALQLLFEAAAVAMDMDHGRETLELLFQDGELELWYRHDQKNRPAELGRYDGRAAWLERSDEEGSTSSTGQS
jgi:hypothetical protein